MLFYNFKMLDGFISRDMMSGLIAEKEFLEKIIILYENKKESYLLLTNNMLEISELIEDDKLETFFNTVSTLKKSLEQIAAISTLANDLKEDLLSTIALCDTEIQTYENEIKANLVEYNKKREELSSSIIDFENINNSVVNRVIQFSAEIILNKKLQMESKSEEKEKNKARVSIEIEPQNLNLLVISEKEQKAFLPFFYNDIKSKFQECRTKYPTMQDVVDDLYVRNLEDYKNSSIARFREGFSLVKNKNHGSVLQALDLGLELMFQHKLNPIIISACRNMEELDIYLDCLEENELHDFPCFEIKFEVMPQKD